MNNNNPSPKRVFIEAPKQKSRGLSDQGKNPNVNLCKDVKGLPQYMYEFKKKYFNKTPKNMGSS